MVISPYGGLWIWVIWLSTLAWLSLTWSAFFYRETDTGIRLTKIDEAIRFVVIPALLISALTSLAGHGPFLAGPGNYWYAAKILIYALMLCIGLYLRFVMREWTELFRVLAVNPDDAAAESTLERSIRRSRYVAYVYWIGISSVAFLGATKAI